MRLGFTATAFVLAGLALAGTAAAITTSETKRIGDAASVLREIRSTPNGDIPQDVWQRARCVAAIPGFKKGGLLVGGEYGKGLVSCRTANGWSAPAYVAFEAGTLGAQIGVESVDLVLLVMNERGVDHLLQDRVALGAEASIAAGPVGRDATKTTDAQLKAEILSYSRSKGLFAGVDLSGGVLRPDTRADRDLYRRAMTARQILVEPGVRTPSAAQPFVAALRDVSRETAATAGTSRPAPRKK